MLSTRWIPWLLILLLAGVAYAQPGRWKGTLNGTVKLKDGTPLGGVTVVITQGADTTRVVTTAAGSFMASLDMGRVTAAIEGVKDPRASATVIINPGGTATASLVFAQSGVLLAAKTLEGEDVQAEPRGAYKTFRRDERDLKPTRLGGLGYFFTDFPADAADFAALAAVPAMGNRTAVFAQQWRIDPNDQTSLRMTVPVVRVRIPVVDGMGAPLRLTRVDGILSYPAQKVPASYWDTREPVAQQVTDNLPAMTTDDRGILDLGLGLVGDYRLTLGTRGAFGREVRFSITGDGRAVLQPYTLLPDTRPPAPRVRDVQQLVLTNEGAPAALADVYATYTYGGKAMLLRDKTDTRGNVTWRDLPAVRVIMWGENVPAGVIDPAVTTVRDALPEPVIDRARAYRVVLTDVGDQPAKVTWLSRIIGVTAVESRETNMTPGRRGGLPAGADQTYDLRPGQPFTVVALTDGIPPRLGVLSRVYAPYVDDYARTIDWELPLKEGAAIEGTIQGERGQVIPKVSRLRVVPVKTRDGYTDPFTALGERSKYVKIEQLGNGRFTANVYVPGTYRFVIDLYDESTPPTPDLLAEVGPGVSRATLTLPAPLFSVPSGTMVYWLNKYSPTTVRQFLAMDSLNDVPVYGTREYVLTAWYQQGPTRMTVLEARGGRPDVLAMRTMFLQPRDAAGRPYRGALRLWPLFPVEPRERPAEQPEIDALTLRGQNIYRISLWPGTYLYDDPDAPEQGFLGTVEVPQAGNTDLVFTVDPTRPLTPPVRLRDIELIFPKTDYTALRKAGAAYLIITVDSTPGFQLKFSEMDITTARPVPIRVPADARSLTIAWLGAGVMQDVAIPRGILRPRVEVGLPAWQPGQRVTGRILDDDGMPVANATVSIGMNGLGTGEHARVTTDARGYFAVEGAVPGPIFVRCDLNRRVNRWPAMLTPRGGMLVFRIGDAARQRTPLAVYLPLDLRNGLPGAVTLTRRDDPNATPMVYPTAIWRPSTVLGMAVTVVEDVPPGNYRVKVDTPRGPLDGTVTVTEWGGAAELK